VILLGDLTSFGQLVLLALNAVLLALNAVLLALNAVLGSIRVVLAFVDLRRKRKR
jgi:hypothetical protein